MPKLQTVFNNFRVDEVLGFYNELRIDSYNQCALGLDLISRYLQFSALVNSKNKLDLNYDDSCNLYKRYEDFLSKLNTKSKIKFGIEDSLLKKDKFFNTELSYEVCDALYIQLKKHYPRDKKCDDRDSDGDGVSDSFDIEPLVEKIQEYFFDPPKPSSKIFVQNFQPTLSTNKDKDTYLKDILLKAKYQNHLNYYYIKGNGFAITTSLEKVNPDGTPKGSEYRWSASNSGIGTFSYYEIFNSIFLDIESDYRMFAFIVDNKNAENRTSVASMTELQNFEKRSYDALPKDLEALNGGKTLSIFVYQFHNDSMDGVPKMVINNNLDFGKYLQNSGLAKLLENKLTR